VNARGQEKGSCERARDAVEKKPHLKAKRNQHCQKDEVGGGGSRLKHRGVERKKKHRKSDREGKREESKYLNTGGGPVSQNERQIEERPVKGTSRDNVQGPKGGGE